MAFWNDVLNGLKDFGKTQTWKCIGMSALGASGHAITPTIIEAVFRKDLSGYKGLLTGIGSTVAVGLALRSPEYILGGMSAATLHFWYGRLNGWIVYPVLNQYLFRFNPVSENSALSGVPAQAQLQDGAKWVEIGGRKVQIFDRSDINTEASAPISTSQQTTTPALQGFQNALPGSSVSASATTVEGFRTAGTNLNGFGTVGAPMRMEGGNRLNTRSKIEMSSLG